MSQWHHNQDECLGTTSYSNLHMLKILSCKIPHFGHKMNNHLSGYQNQGKK